MDLEKSKWTLYSRTVSIWMLFAHLTALQDYFFNQVKTDIPLNQTFFPSILSGPTTAAIIYSLLLISDIALIVTNKMLFAIIVTVCCFLMLIHEQGFFIQSMVISFWTGMFLIWLVSKPVNEKDALLISRLIISLIFLSGVCGKLTPEYWSGEIFYNLNFPRFSNSVEISAFFSRLTIFSEGFLGVSFLFRSRQMAVVALATITGMWYVIVPKAVDAVGPVLGIAAANILILYKVNIKYQRQLIITYFAFWLLSWWVFIPLFQIVMGFLIRHIVTG